MKVVAIIQARMNSSRLPGKILMKVLDKPLLEYQVDRLRRASLLDEIVIATTVGPKDDAVAEWAGRQALPCFRGPEYDVLARYAKAADLFGADAIVRLTADCPILDPRIVDQVVHAYKSLAPEVDYVSNILKRTFPRGMDTEIFSARALKQAHIAAERPYDREHVTPYLYNQPHLFRTAGVTYSADESRYRLTVDTPEDFQLIQRIIEVLYPTDPHFSLETVLELLRTHPEWAEINAHIEQAPAM
ncbi:3-deoxy-manno-octulosonate cytidylyltransferase [Chlamydia abortus]|uniref:Cytidylyltransferase domain-containing protein n=1 Tax=Paenibacillus residui TaxID=629724 RepID=A0ABW3DC91_9BACL|nr:3-deoxy-manno-octulosonate cytidylyltransferase [Chlamydia abortus]